MRIFVIFLMLFVFTPGAWAQGHAAPSQEEQVYICPMHPHITGKKGDHCPICGMTLVPKVSDPGQEEEPTRKPEEKKTETQGALHIDPVYVQALGVRTGEVAHRTFGTKIRAFGRITPSTRGEYTVSVRAGGLVRALKTAAIGDSVKRGDFLFTLYSSELVVAQQDYLSRATSGAHRLRILGMDETAIAQLDREKKILYDVPFHAQSDGIVTELNVREGSSVEEGDTVLKIQDFSRVWVEAQLPAKDMGAVKPMDPATVQNPQTGAARSARVDFVSPELDEATRTGTVRLVLENTDGALRPGQYLDVVFTIDPKKRLSVPTGAILYDARGAHVIKALGDGYFSLAAIKTGASGDGYTEILSGLSHADQVVVTGQFLIDAESTLRGGSMQMSGPDQGKSGGAHVH
ncbi:MAG: efflux RND transporter periplasmic adaptor subunit [Rhodospirillales bacterium]|nr:efflux RND transporter periplasmic adaptor subunit [Rhodospirillales bacterium]